MIGHRTTVGLDVHAHTVVACGLDAHTGQVKRRLTLVAVPPAGLDGSVLGSARLLGSPIPLPSSLALAVQLATVARAARMIIR